MRSTASPDGHAASVYRARVAGRRGPVLVAVALLALACTGDDDGGAAVPRPTSTIASTGRVDARVPIGGRALHIVCEGEGAPVVVIELGLNSKIETWTGMQAVLASRQRTCIYERAGHGPSDAGSEPRTAQRIADELAALLDAAAIKTPVVLLSHSVGGMYAESFAQRHPGDVAGLVFVDPRTAEFEAGYRKLLEPQELEAERRDALDSHATAAGEELASLETSANAILAAGRLPDVPMVVLTAGVRQTFVYERGTDALWVSSHEHLAAQSSRGRHTIVDGAHHAIWLSDPDALVLAVREVSAAPR